MVSWRTSVLRLFRLHSREANSYITGYHFLMRSEMGATFGVSPGKIPNTIGYNLLGVAVGPLFWNPLSRVCQKNTRQKACALAK